MSDPVGFRIEADSLHRLVYNSLLFDTKAAKAYIIMTNSMVMNTSDGQVYLEDVAEITGGPFKETFIISAEESKNLEKYLRNLEGTLEVWLMAGGLDVYALDDKGERIVPAHLPDGIFVCSMGEYAQQSALFDEMLHGDGSLTFGINPDRLRKLSLLQPKDYPVDCKLRYIYGNEGELDPGEAILFKKGPTVRGAYALLDRDKLIGDTNEHLWP